MAVTITDLKPKEIYWLSVFGQPCAVRYAWEGTRFVYKLCRSYVRGGVSYLHSHVLTFETRRECEDFLSGLTKRRAVAILSKHGMPVDVAVHRR